MFKWLGAREAVKDDDDDYGVETPLLKRPRFDLLPFIWRGKHWHWSAGLWAKLKASLLVLGGHETEICAMCGGKVGLVWWCHNQALWEHLTGWAEGGVCCIACFDRLAQLNGRILIWSPNEELIER